MSPTLVFDIETIPDIKALRELYELPDSLSDTAVVEMVHQKQRAKTGSDFLSLHLHRVIVIACVLREEENLRIWSLGGGAEQESERTIVQRFFDGIERYTPQLVSWNGGGFDLPVLHYRSLMHNVVAPRYWEIGDEDKDFRYNNYLSRYHMRHLDMMDLLALYQPRAYASLDEMAKLCGLPGKLGLDGKHIWGAFQEGKLAAIGDYCEVDVLNTYLLFLRFQLTRGLLSEAAYRKEIALVRSRLHDSPEAHWREFLAGWPEVP